jgi:RNA polymerase sigma-70 factor (ECF subfamily)
MRPEARPTPAGPFAIMEWFASFAANTTGEETDASQAREDDELATLALAGDREAFTRLYRRYQDVVFRFALHMGCRESLAEDVTQEVFLALWRNARRYDRRKASPTTYLYGIARNITRRRQRRDRIFRAFTDLENDRLESEEMRVKGSALDDTVKQEAIERVRHAVRRLPQKYRELVVLCDLHGRSYADAAAIVGCTVGTVRSRLHRARELLGDKLRRSEAVVAAEWNVS